MNTLKAGMVAWGVLCAAVGGCDTGQVTRLRDTAEVKQAIHQSDKPVLVDFYKGGCPTCVPVDGMMATLEEEYKGRVTVARFMLMQPYFAVTSPELMKEYGISTFPTVILFVHGRETWRFLRDYDLDDYRKGMNEALAMPAAGPRGINAARR